MPFTKYGGRSNRMTSMRLTELFLAGTFMEMTWKRSYCTAQKSGLNGWTTQRILYRRKQCSLKLLRLGYGPAACLSMRWINWLEPKSLLVRYVSHELYYTSGHIGSSGWGHPPARGAVISCNLENGQAGKSVSMYLFLPISTTQVQIHNPGSTRQPVC